METTPSEPDDASVYDEIQEHLLAVRKLLSGPAVQGRALASSGSPHASQEGEEARKRANRLRDRMRVLVKDVRSLEAALVRAQGWHDRYEYVKRME